jgi:hypothetical protein
MFRLALPFALGLEPRHVIASAGRADHNSIGPTLRNHVSYTVIRVCEEEDCGLQCLWAVHVDKNSLTVLICQLYYYLYLSFGMREIGDFGA